MSEQFEKAILDYFQNRKRFDYLSLDFPMMEFKNLIEFGIHCASKDFGHLVHSGDKHLNLLSDLSIIQARNLEVIFDRINLLSKVSLKHFSEIEKRLNTLEQNQRNLEKVLLQTRIPEGFEKTLSKLPEKSEIFNLILSITDQPKRVETETNILVKQIDSRIEKLEILTRSLTKKLV